MNAWPERIYTFALRLYPPRFQAEFSEEMRQVFSDRLNGQPAPARLRLLLGELLATPLALWNAYHLAHYRPGLPAGWRQRLWAALTAAPQEDGRASWRQAAWELLPFALVGALLLAEGYLTPALPPQSGQMAAGRLALAARLLPAPFLALGLLRGAPRWVYPWAGMALGTLAAAAAQNRLLPILAACLAGFVILALAADCRRLDYPALLRKPGSDWPRAAFGFYGLLPLVVSLAYDDGLLDNRGPWLALSAALMLAGAAGFARGRTTTMQAAALLAGLTGALVPALLDRALTGAGPALTGWVGLLWLILSALVAAPFLAGLGRLRRAARES